MNLGIVLFIYDRPQCTVRVLDALKRNHVEELFVFQDGLGEKTDKEAWMQNEILIKQIDWCRTVFEQNKYKASSLDSQIIYGINKVFEQKDALIIIEDDCVISDDCIRFMERCLTQYRESRNVIDIGAYLEPIKVPEDYVLPVIAAGIPAGQVWGTWKDRWDEFQEEFAIIKKIGDAMQDKPMFGSFGYPIKKILTEYWMLGTWDLWWSIYVLLKGGISVRPVGNKVFNIGFENPGTHTSGESPWVVPISDRGGDGEKLPDDIRVEQWAEAEFKRFYQEVNGGKPLVERQTYYRSCLENWLEFKLQGKSIGDVLLKQGMKEIAIYGMGNIGKLLVEDLDGKVRIDCFIVTDKKTDTFMGYPVYGCGDILPEGTEQLTLIVIPGYDLEKIEDVMAKRFSDIYPLDVFINNISC